MYLLNFYRKLLFSFHIKVATELGSFACVWVYHRRDTVAANTDGAQVAPNKSSPSTTRFPRN